MPDGSSIDRFWWVGVSRIVGKSPEFKMRESVRRFVAAWRNPIGVGLFLIHVALLLSVMALKAPIAPPSQTDEMIKETGEVSLQWASAGESIYASRVFHYHYESPLVKFLMLADIPGHFVGSHLVAVPLLVLWLMGALSLVGLSRVNAAVWVLFGSIQWWIVGTWFYLQATKTAKQP